MLRYILSSEDHLEIDIDDVINVNKLWSKLGLEIHFNDGVVVEATYIDGERLTQDYNYLMYNLTNRDDFDLSYKPKLEVVRCQCGSELVYGKDTTFHADYCDKKIKVNKTS